MCDGEFALPVCAVGTIKRVEVVHGEDIVPRAEVDLELLREVDYDSMVDLLNRARPKYSMCSPFLEARRLTLHSTDS